MLYKPFNYIDEVWMPITGDIVPGIIENKYIVSNYGFISKNYKIPLGRHGRIFNDDQINKICSILEQDGINTTTIDIINKLGIAVDGSMQKYNNIISAIKHKRRYTYISDNYAF